MKQVSVRGQTLCAPLLAMSGNIIDHAARMPTIPRSSPTLADVVTASAVLDGDEKRRQTTVAERDRRIGLALPPSDDRAQVVLGWLDAIRDEDAEVERLHGRVQQAVVWCGTLITLLGLVLGLGAALGVFFFDGSGRVNAVGVIAVLVLLPGLFLLLFIAAALPARFLAPLPGGRALTALARGLSPGRLGSVILRFFPSDFRQAWEGVTGQTIRRQTLYQGIQKWAILRWSQLLALGFQAAALAAAICLVLFTDLAFGWSTTLTSGNPIRDAETIHSLTSTMAAPWSWTLESAAPTLSLIEESRYFRAAEHSLTPEQAARLGAWWPFIILSLLVYGLLPRIITSAVAGTRLGHACRVTVRNLPGFPPVLRRLRQAHLQTTSDEPETGRTDPEQAKSTATLSIEPESIGLLINWSAVPMAEGDLKALFGNQTVHQAGGAASVAGDRSLVEEEAAKLPSGSGVVVVVKAWEPPLMELVDFLKLLRTSIPNESPIFIVPAGIDSATRIADGTPGQVEIWRRKIAGLGDPWLEVRRASEVDSP